MKGIKERVLAKLHAPEKVELQSEKVELGIADDLKKYEGYFSKWEAAVISEKNKIDSIRKELLDLFEVSNSLITDLMNDMGKFEKSAKDLGINPSDSKVYNSAEKVFKQFAKEGDNLNQFAKKLK
jgi:NDP-sugar pyrophosphorylase family protein